MENASKALLIAAAVLVVIILVAVGMKIYSSTTGTQKVAMDTGKSISDKTGDATKFATEQITGVKAIDYGSKTKETIEPGDDIIIGGTEKFKVFSVGNDGIKAIPYYNLKLDSKPIRQATKEEAEAGLEGTTSFTKSNTVNATTSWELPYWSSADEEIPMDNSAIQPYIIQYEAALKRIRSEKYNSRGSKI